MRSCAFRGLMAISCFSALSLTIAAGSDAEGVLSCARYSVTEQDALICASSVTELTKEQGVEAIEAAMERGWWQLTEKLVDVADTLGVDLSTAVHQTSSKIRTRLQSLADKLSGAQHSDAIPPAFEWAQSSDAIFLNVKFAHKLDTPATLGCEAEAPQYPDGGKTVRFRAHCKEKRKTFLLNLQLYRAVDMDNSTWSTGSVGRATLTLRKSAAGKWPRLLTSSKKLGHMHTWWAMSEKYEQELKDFEKAETERKKAEAKDGGSASNTAAPASGDAAAEATPTPAAATPAAASSTDAAGAADATAAAELAGTDSGSSASGSGSSSDTLFSRLLQRPTKARTRDLAAVDAAEAEELKALDADIRAAKAKVDEKARAEKAALEAEYESKRRDMLAAKSAARSAIEARYAEEVAKLKGKTGQEQDSGEGGEDKPLALPGPPEGDAGKVEL